MNLKNSYGVQSETLFNKDQLGLKGMAYAEESDYFLGDDLVLPNELKWAQAETSWRLLYGPMAQSQKEQSEVKTQKPTDDFMPETDKPEPKPTGSNDFE